MNETFRQPLLRRLEILKYLQGGEKHIGQIVTDLLGNRNDSIDTRTIRKDLEVLRKGMDVLGTTVKIEESRKGHAKLYYESTVHPVFLALNLTELFALLQLLEKNAEDRVIGPELQAIFDKVYGQTTEYARGIIDSKLQKKHLLKKVQNRLDEENFHDNIMYWIKSGRPVFITYKTQKGEEIKRKCRVINYDQGIMTFENLEKKIVVKRPFESITIHWNEVEYQ